MAKSGVQKRATSPTLGSVPENGLSEVEIIRTFTVATESTELGLLVVLIMSWSLIGERSLEGEDCRSEKSDVAFTLWLTKFGIEGRRWGKRRRPRESQGWQFALPPSFVGLRSGVLGW